MSSQRKIIRHAIKDLLKGKTACEGKVFASRFRSVFEMELPCILIYTKNEPAKVWQQAPVEYERNLELVIEIVAAADEKLDDFLDDVADDVEYWMHQDHTHGEVCADTILKNSEVVVSTSGDTLIGSAVLTYTMPYYTEAVKDSKDLRVLARADVKWNLHSDDPAASGIEAEDTINSVTGDE